MYVCGPTVYSHPHIGNARAALIPDILYRLLLSYYPGDVVYIRNITDVDDKILKAANEQGVKPTEISEKFTDVYLNNMDQLNILHPTHQPKVTEFMDSIISMIHKIIDSGHGYVENNHVLFNTEKDNDERIVANIGLGKRSLSQDNTLMSGFNVFLDYDDAGNLRSSFGLEARSAVLEFMYNYYFGLDDASDEKVLDGYELGLASQIPYLHWADVFVNTYEWEGVSRDDVKGTKIGSELLLSPTLNLEIAYDDKDKKGLEDAVSYTHLRAHETDS